MNALIIENIITQVVYKSLLGHIEALPLWQRSVFELYMNGLNESEIALQLGGNLSEAVVADTIRKIKLQIRGKYSDFSTPCI